MLENTIPSRPSMGTQVHGRPSKGVLNSKSMDNYLMMTSSAQQEVTSGADLGEYQFYFHLYFSLDSQKEMKNLLQLSFLSSMDFQLRKDYKLTYGHCISTFEIRNVNLQSWN